MPLAIGLQASVTMLLGVEAAQLRLLESRMQLHLVDGGHHSGRIDDGLKVLDLEVRDADRPGTPSGLQLDQRLPGLDVEVPRGGRPVDEVQVDVVEPETVEAPVEGTVRGLAAVVGVPELVVTNTSPRPTPLPRMALPTSRSLP
jgi:hypothetical protein